MLTTDAQERSSTGQTIQQKREKFQFLVQKKAFENYRSMHQTQMRCITDRLFKSLR